MSVAFKRILELGIALKIPPLNTHDGCWEYQVDERWFFAANGHDEPHKISNGPEVVSPYTVYVKYNGWPAGVLDYSGGCLADGECANEDTLIAALESAIAKVPVP